MSEHGAALQTYNQELVKCLEDLRLKREKLQTIIDGEENNKNILEKNIKALQDKLHVVNTNLNNHRDIRDNYDRMIKDAENGFKKIVLKLCSTWYNMKLVL
nr:Sjoegren syndrome nuclear autoantigen 1 homolog isoform X2 [Onthophagus taurus]